MDDHSDDIRRPLSPRIEVYARLSFKTYASRGRSAVIKSFMGAPWGLVAASRAALLNP